MSYEEGTVGFLIEQLNKIKDKNKKVYQLVRKTLLFRAGMQALIV